MYLNVHYYKLSKSTVTNIINKCILSTLYKLKIVYKYSPKYNTCYKNIVTVTISL